MPSGGEALVSPGDGQVQIAVVVVVAPAKRAAIHSVERRAHVGERSRVVSVDPGGLLEIVVLPRYGQVQVAVVVEIAPGHRAKGHAFEPSADVGERTRVVAVV